MPPPRLPLALVALLLLAGCIGVRQRMTPPPEISITTAAESDEIVLSFRQNEAGASWSAVLDLTSPTGIGSGRVSLMAGAWPEPVLLRLHLAGLEELTLKTGEAVVQLSISSVPERTLRQVDAAGQSLSPASPLWLDVSLGDGYFDVLLPPDLLASAGGAFEIRWIDFYR